MKAQKKILSAAAMLLLLSTNCWGGEKAKLGPCVRQCVRAFNPSLADSGAQEFLAENFRARDCVELCKENLYQGECNSLADNCCNPDFLDMDPDCQDELPPDPPGPPDPPDPPDQPDPPENGLPPDPGEAGKATLEGVDSDGDGLRDDIQRYIALTYPDSQKTRAALQQFALALDKSILESSDEERALFNTEFMHRASECLWYIHAERSIKMTDLLMSEYLNTLERSRAYLDYDAKLSGHVFGGKDFEEYNTSCTFDPDLMED